MVEPIAGVFCLDNGSRSTLESVLAATPLVATWLELAWPAAARRPTLRL